MQLQRLELFSTKKEFGLFLLACGFILAYALLIEYNNYKNLTRFDSALVHAKILKQYEKTKTTKSGKIKTYQVLKLKSDKGFSFYTTAKKNTPHAKNKTIALEIYPKKLSFYAYMTSFYAYSKILHMPNTKSAKESLNTLIASQHANIYANSIYQALYTATPLEKELYPIFSTLGISHLFAISGFHLGVLAAVLFFLFKYPYRFFQSRYFPYRSYQVDSFLTISVVLLGYLLFLDMPPSLLRAYVMLVIGFVLYDRGYKIISMQTLLLTVLVLLSFFPRLFFAIGFWLSVAGVYSIFLFLIHFTHLKKLWQFILIPFWVYFLMLPFSLYMFEYFGIYNPLSILFTTLFTIFYPLSIVLHLLGVGALLDGVVLWIISLGELHAKMPLPLSIFVTHIALMLIAMKYKTLSFLVLLWSVGIFSYAIFGM